ncbi:MAG: hypothetical protein PHG91_00435 [Syntrophales bacterium]|nr:hypothetical protein [Syntrophales bacterium]MDD5231836.1 hypothetical protein [Syntrophales bacterium]MDD5531360.1 hypothetical protein [Syntrophales bacterium]
MSILPPKISGQIKIPGGESSARTAVPGMALGETLDALIAGRTDYKNVLIRIRGAAIAAETEVPLEVGEKIQVRVDSLQPRVVLSVIGRTNPETSILNDYLRLFRSSPKGMADLMGALLERIRTLEAAGRLLQGGMQGELRQLLESLLLTKETVKDPLWLQRYIAGLGLLWEKGLLKAARERSSEIGGKSLKSVLMNLIAESPAAAGDPAAAVEIKGLAELLLKTIEAHQVVNILSQERDGRFFIQVPFLTPGGVGAGDILIETEEREGKGKRDARKFNIRISVEMDVLGRLNIDAGISAGALSCSIRCCDDTARDFITGSLDSLADGLKALGYRIERLECYVGKDNPEESMTVLAEVGSLDIKI